jgi:PAS domain S-box-containing protein
MTESVIDILLVEDSPGDASLIKGMLKTAVDFPCHVEQADRLSVAKNILQTGNIDAVLLDLSLPDSQGLDALVSIRELAPDIPILIVTGLEDREMTMRATQAGAQDYLVKSDLSGPLLVRAMRLAMVRQQMVVQSSEKAERLKVSERRMRTLIEAHIKSIIVVDEKGFLRFVNPAAEAVLGRDANELLGEQFGYPVISGETTELDILYPNGETAVVEMSFGQTGWEGERVYLVSLHNITAQRVAEDQLRKLSSAIEHSPSSVFIYDKNGIIEYANPKFTQISGYPLDEVLGTHVSMLNGIDPEEEKKIWDVISSGKEWHGEILNKKKQGTYYWVSASISSIRNNVGNITHYIELHEDITARKQAEAEIRRRVEELNLLNQVISVVTSQKSEEEILNTVCEELASFFKVLHIDISMIDESQMFAKVVAERCLPDHPSIKGLLTAVSSSPALKKVYETGQPLAILDVPQYLQSVPEHPQLQENEVSSLLFAPVPVRGQVVGILRIISNIPREFSRPEIDLVQTVGEEIGRVLETTRLYIRLRAHTEELEQRVTERTRELADANERLLALDKLKSKFVSDVSHELRTPVANLALYLDLLSNGKIERREHYVETLKKQTNRLTQLIEGILDISRLEADPKISQFAPVNLNEIVREVCTAHSPRAQAAQLTLRAEYASLPVCVFGNHHQLIQVATNLISNAINYTLTGEICVSVYQDPERKQVCLQVADSGIGIKLDDLPHVFDRFYRGQDIGSYDIPGTGLGLNIVKEIVVLHGGFIDLKTAVGEGSTFSVWLPICEEDSAHKDWEEAQP